MTASLFPASKLLIIVAFMFKGRIWILLFFIYLYHILYIYGKQVPEN